MLNFTLFGFQVFDLAYYFIIYAFFGWLLETVYASLLDGRFINRGFLHGPFCPIYGFGSVLLIVALHPVLENVILLFIGAVVLTSVLEYLTGLVLEKIFDHKWWDYSNRRFNIRGMVCLRFSIYWGIISILMLKYLQLEVDQLVGKIPYQYGLLGIYVLGLYFLVDFVQTLRTVIELKELITHAQRLTLEGREKLEQIKESSVEGLEATLGEIKAQYEALYARRGARHHRLFNAFPNLKAKVRHNERILKNIRDRFNQMSPKG
ncbi:MAG: putative ABC transporter permease [Syntrophomonas sp.]|nr:putative ABC transporter permease [Syntrophomonadaceae bacterium]